MSESTSNGQERTDNDRPAAADDPSVIVVPPELSRQERKEYLGVSS